MFSALEFPNASEISTLLPTLPCLAYGRDRRIQCQRSINFYFCCFFSFCSSSSPSWSSFGGQVIKQEAKTGSDSPCILSNLLFVPGIQGCWNSKFLFLLSYYLSNEFQKAYLKLVSHTSPLFFFSEFLLFQTSLETMIWQHKWANG